MDAASIAHEDLSLAALLAVSDPYQTTELPDATATPVSTSFEPVALQPVSKAVVPVKRACSGEQHNSTGSVKTTTRDRRGPGHFQATYRSAYSSASERRVMSHCKHIASKTEEPDRQHMARASITSSAASSWAAHATLAAKMRVHMSIIADHDQEAGRGNFELATDFSGGAECGGNRRGTHAGPHGPTCRIC